MCNEKRNLDTNTTAYIVPISTGKQLDTRSLIHNVICVLILYFEQFQNLVNDRFFVPHKLMNAVFFKFQMCIYILSKHFLSTQSNLSPAKNILQVDTTHSINKAPYP